MKILLILFLLTGVCYADIVYYDKTTKKTVIDISGVKPIALIKSEFGLSDQVESITLAEKEAYRIKGNKLEKFNYKEDNKQLAEARKVIKDQKKNKIKQKLGLSESEWNDLVDAVK